MSAPRTVLPGAGAPEACAGEAVDTDRPVNDAATTASAAVSAGRRSRVIRTNSLRGRRPDIRALPARCASGALHYLDARRARLEHSKSVPSQVMANMARLNHIRPAAGRGAAAVGRARLTIGLPPWPRAAERTCCTAGCMPSALGCRAASARIPVPSSEIPASSIATWEPPGGGWSRGCVVRLSGRPPYGEGEMAGRSRRPARPVRATGLPRPSEAGGFTGRCPHHPQLCDDGVATCSHPGGCAHKLGGVPHHQGHGPSPG